MNMTITGIKQPSVEMLDKLQKGGYVLYFRHAEPIEHSGDPGLSADGAAKAKALGNWFREKRITVNVPVLTSPARRTQETGRAAFQDIRVEQALYHVDTLFIENPTGEALEMKTRLLGLLESTPAEGTNRVLVGHSFTFNGQVEARPYLGLILLQPIGNAQGYEIVDAFNF